MTPHLHLIFTWAWHLTVFWPSNILAAAAVGEVVSSTVALLDLYLLYCAYATQVCVCK